MDIFCKIIAGEIPSKRIYEDEKVIVILDVNPRSNGHLLIIPKVHYKDSFEIDIDLSNYIMKIAIKMGELLMKKLNCDGITMEINNGISQEVKHFHLHVIPKYKENINLKEIDEIYTKLKGI